MAAAPADFRPVGTSSYKIKKADDGSAPTIVLAQNPDILHELAATRGKPGQVVVGFAAETGDADRSVLELGRAKLARKGCDLLAVNYVGEGGAFEGTENSAVVLGSDGSSTEVPRGSKEKLANVLWDLVLPRIKREG